MARARPSYIWRKAASGSWLSARETRLHEQTGGEYAVIERPGRERLLIESFCRSRRRAEQLRKLFGGWVVQLAPDWEAQAFAATRVKPMRIGKRLNIVSETSDLPKNATRGAVLIIPAGAAFGTGGHATTAMSLRILERFTRALPKGWRMLDAGTGSGILALAGSRFGAREVIAIDNDPVAISTAKANARANRVRNAKFIVGDVKEKPRRAFEIITANLYSELLAEVLPRWRTSLRAEGGLVLSGVMRSQEHALQKVLRASGFSVEETRRRGKWIALLCRQKRS
jgi:ribosomal protein L11 methyltransferase